MEIQFENLLNLTAIEVDSVEIQDNTIDIYCHSKLEESYCPHCLNKNAAVNKVNIRQIRDLPLMGRKTTIHLKSRQFVCSVCKRHYFENFDFVEPNETVTKRYANSVFKLCNGIELQHVVVIEDLCWQTVNRIYYKEGKKQIKDREKNQIMRIGIDEIAMKKGHKDYVAVIVNLDTGEVIDLLEGRSKELIMNCFYKKGEAFCRQIKVFCSDLWEGYLSSAKELFPNAIIVTDRFHFYSKIQTCVDSCRQYYRNKYSEDEDLKNIKWLLLKNREDLTKKEKDTLRKVLEKPEYILLKQVYESKTIFKSILDEDISKEEATKKIELWIEEIEKTPNRFLRSFIDFFNRWKEYILNYFEGRYHTSLIEGINNKIKSIKRRAYGFANFEHFKVRVICAFI
jgi:transposase